MEVAKWNGDRGMFRWWTMIGSDWNLFDKELFEIDEKTDMQKLTLLEDIMPDEVVRYYFPTADEEDVDWIFNKTSYHLNLLKE